MGDVGLSPRVRGRCSLGVPVVLAFLVYPRVCGVDPTSSPRTATLGGLAPRVRGRFPGTRPPVLCEGFIPACAG